jgi:hypothetical protein
MYAPGRSAKRWEEALTRRICEIYPALASLLPKFEKAASYRQAAEQTNFFSGKIILS